MEQATVGPLCIFYTWPLGLDFSSVFQPEFQPPTLASLLVSFPWPWSVRVHSSQELSSLRAALDNTPTLLGAASEGQVSYLSPQPGSRRYMGPQPRRHPRRGFPLPHLPPLPTSVSRDYLRKPNRRSVSSQKKCCLSSDSCQGLCTN